ncbi:MAG: hypothetical protein LBF89_03375 [Bacteroidales bacterium]|nr:hypothetical protein [Bacteroidales bacterium]
MKNNSSVAPRIHECRDARRASECRDARRASALENAERLSGLLRRKGRKRETKHVWNSPLTHSVSKKE